MVASDRMPCCAQFLVDPRGSVETAVLLEHCLDLSGEPSVHGRPLSRRILPLPSGVVAPASHPKLAEKPGHRVSIDSSSIRRNLSAVAAATASGSTSGCGKVCCRQPEKSLSLLSTRFSLPSRLSSARFLAREEPLAARNSLAPVNADLPRPTGQAAGGKPKPLGNGVAGEDLLQTELHGLRLLLRRELTPWAGGVGHRRNDLVRQNRRVNGTFGIRPSLGVGLSENIEAESLVLNQTALASPDEASVQQPE